MGAASTPRKSIESSRRLMALGSVSGVRQALGKQASASRRHGQIDRRQQRAVAGAAQGPGELEIGACRRTTAKST